MKSKSVLIAILITVILGAIYIIYYRDMPRGIREKQNPAELLQFKDDTYGISFQYPKSWSEVEVLPGSKVCPEEDTYRTPETLSIYDKEYRFPDEDTEGSTSLIRGGIRVYRLDPNTSNGCNDELLRKLALREMTGEEISSFKLIKADIGNFYGVFNENASRLDTEARPQYTLFFNEGTDILVIQPYMSFIPFSASPEWNEIESNYAGDVPGYIREGKTAGWVRSFIGQFKETTKTLKKY